MIGYGNSYFISTILDSGVGNPPVNTVAPVISGGTSLGSVLSSTTGTWTGDAPITYTYQWYRGINAIGGATNSTYTIVVADSGANITCQVTATNAKGSSSAASNVITSQTFTSPANTSAPAITGTAQEGQTLSCSTGLWTGNPIVSFTYQWKRNGSNIGSATNSTYTLVTADVGQSIKCTVTATNFIGSANADSNTVTPTSSTDADAQAFITAAGITNPTQQSAINQLVTDLKGYNIWTKMKAIYPFVGGTAATHKWNLKDPRDLDAAFRLVFNGGWTHSSTGALPNGTNAYADTKFNPVTNSLAYNNNHLSYYSRTQAATVNAVYEMGSGNSVSGGTALFCRRITDSASYDCGTGVANRLLISPWTNGSGFFVGSSINTNIGYFFVNGSQQQFKNPLTSVSMQGYNYYVGAFNEQNTTVYYSNKQCAFSSIGTGLTTTELANFYTAVQAFQTTLGRQV